MRERFHEQELGKGAVEGLFFAESFEDVVRDGPAGLPLSLKSRLAVVYADGNGFGHIRNDLKDNARFANRLATLRRDFLRRVVDWHREGLDQAARFSRTADGKQRLRFETLLWGGDELMFVMPSWLAFGFVEHFFAATQNWNIDGRGLTHGAGLVICHYKTPIRQARALAKQIADEIKERVLNGESRNAVGIEIFESLVPPEDDLASHRSRLYFTHRAEGKEEAKRAPAPQPISEEAKDRITRDLAFPGDEFADLRQRLRLLRTDGAEGLPRSQLYRILRGVDRCQMNLASGDASKLVRDELEDYEKRVHKSASFSTAGRRLPFLGLEGDRDRARSLAIELALIAQFWDYADPFAEGEPLPDFPGSAPG